MAEPTFNLFGPVTDKDLKVAYISTDRGYQDNVSVCDANLYAKANPGAVFIFKPDRTTVNFLNINQVNAVAKLKDRANTDTSCPDGLNMNATPDPTKVVFMGGGGVGVAANPVVGDDGAVLAVDMVNEGFGYKYPPIVEVRDDSGIGAGAVVSVEMCNVEEKTIYYADKEDFEEYEICPSPLPEDEYGKRYSPDGTEIGAWDPERYTDDKSVPFSEVVDQYIKDIQESGKDWWTTRKYPPLAVTSDGGTTKEKYNVQHWGWGGTKSALTEVEFEIHWHSPHRTKGLGFEFIADDGSHSFRLLDTSRKTDGKRKDVYQVKENTTYKVRPIGKRPGPNLKGPSQNEQQVFELAEMGLLSTMKSWKSLKKVGADGKANKLKLERAGEGDKIFADFLDTLDDSDDIQVQATRGKFTASNPREALGAGGVRQTYDLTYRLQTGKQTLEPSFMNAYAISPKPPSNVKGSDFAGRWYTFEWDVDFPYDGEYIFRGARDNKAFLYVDNQNIGSLKHLRGKKRVGTITGKGFKKNIKKGNHKLRIDLYNDVVREKVLVQQSSGESSTFTGKSTESEGTQTREIFNTVDYINKANRQLWRTNVYQRGGFINDYGVCPFDTKLELKDNPYAGDHKIVWPNVNFPIDGNYVIEVQVDDNVDLTIGDQVNLVKKGFDDNGHSTGILRATRFIKQGNHNITADLHQIPGGVFSFKAYDGKTKTKINFNVNVGGVFGNQITIPGLFALAKNYGEVGSSLNQEYEVEIGKEYDVVLTSIRTEGGRAEENVRKGAIRFRTSVDKSGQISDKGPRLEYEDLLKTNIDATKSHGDIIARASQGRFYGAKGNRCKFMVGETIKGINPMSLAINIETEFDEKEIDVKKSWNENPMGVAMTVEAPNPPIPQEPIPVAEGRCPNNPFWTTRFPGAKNLWHPVRVDGWGDLLNDYAISPLPPYDKHRNALVDATFEVHWYSPHRSKGLGYEFVSEDGSHSFRIIDTSRSNKGQKSETHKVKANMTYNVKAIGQRAHAQGSKIGKSALGSMDNSKVIELAEQGLLQTMGKTGGGKNIDKFKGTDLSSTGDKIFADFLDTLDDADDIQIQAGVGQFTASNERFVQSLRGKRRTYDLTYRISGIPPNDSGNFTNTWTKDFPYGGWYKVKMEVDDIGEFWIDDEKVLDLSRRRGKTSDEKLIYIEGPTSDDNQTPVSHDIKVVVENYKNERMKEIDAKVFSTLDWIGGGSSKAEVKPVNFKITSGALFANGIKIPELGIDVSKRYKGPQINAKLVKDVEINKVYDVELFSTQSRDGVRLRTRGESVLEMEEATDNDWSDIVCGASEGRFFDFKPGPNKATCKYVVTGETKVSGGISGSTTRRGVTYEGPHLFHYQDSRWGKLLNQQGVSPIGSPTQNLSDPNDNILGWKTLRWKNVDFPQTGNYDISFIADNKGKLFIDDKEYLRDLNPDNYGVNEYSPVSVEVGKGKHDIKIELFNAHHGYRKDATDNDKRFLSNPTGVMLKITTKMTVGTGSYRSWKENPMGVAAKLIPPPCPKKVKGKGQICDPIVRDPGNGYPRPEGGGYPVLLKIKKVIPIGDPINYNCKIDSIRLEPSMGSELELVCGPFGTIPKINVIKPGLGFTRVPDVIVDSDTGVNLDVIVQFEPEIAPFDVPDVIQVTDLVGLKQTGYYKGRPYYGSVFYEDGVKYSGWYRTAGELVQVYDTLQESIDATVTTPPSAILRQGSDVSSNDPRLNIPGTPENLI